MWVKNKGNGISTASHKRMRARIGGLLKVMKQWKKGDGLTKEEQKRVDYLIRRLTEILEQDATDTAKTEKAVKGMQWVEPVPNPDCEFYDVDQNRIQCKIGRDMYHCSKECMSASDRPGSLPPYGTKYMNGML